MNNHFPHDGGITANEIDRRVDMAALVRVLMEESIKNFAESHRALL